MMIRRARDGDRGRLYEICLRTGSAGEDATDLYADRHLLGNVYVGPYLALEPDLSFVLDDTGAVTGYVLGAGDTAQFQRRCEQEWWPPLRSTYADPPTGRPWTPDERLSHLVHHPSRTDPAVLAAYPAHVHLDLLPQAQGYGYGRRLMQHLLAEMRAASVPGVHLGVDARNERAIGFYRHLGWRPLPRGSGGLLMGLRIAP
ncbi:MAG: GNAT family N-acetyltransferase [Jiangellaceae bacterium]